MLSLIYPGNFTSLEAMRPAVSATEESLHITPSQRHRIVWRTDGGFGSDANLRWLIGRDYHTVAKGFSWKRARAWAGRVSNWTEVRPRRWLAWAPDQLDLGRPTRIVAVRWLTPKGRIRHALYITTLLDLSLLDIAKVYNDRGGAENEIGGDKVGLKITHRRSQRMLSQEALVLLADLAHNLLAWFHRAVLTDSPFAGYGPKRIIRQLLHIPGELVFDGETLVKVRLKESHFLAEPVLGCLTRLWEGDETLRQS